MPELNDHDLLIELRTEMRGVRNDIRDLKDGTSERLSAIEKSVDELESFKASKVDMEKIETRLDRVRTTQNIMVGGLIIVNTIIPFVIKFLFE